MDRETFQADAAASADLPELSQIAARAEGDGPGLGGGDCRSAGLGRGTGSQKDLAAVSSAGRPKVGYLVSELTRDLEHFLGYGTRNRAVLVGLGNLGLALMSLFRICRIQGWI